MIRFGSLSLLVALFLILFAAPQALAQDSAANPPNQDVTFVPRESAPDADAAPSDDKDAKASDDAGSSDDVVKGHGFQLAMTFLGIPDGALDSWFYKHGSTWENSVNMGMSFDYFLRFTAPCELRFSLSWVNLRTGDDYWLPEDYKDRPTLADYVVNDHHAVAIEVAAYHVVQIIDEVAFYYGGGGWAGFILGDSRSYAIRSTCARQTDDLGTCPHEPGAVPVTGIPDFFGFVVVSLGFKFTLLDIMTIRAEGGFKGYLYGQLGVGIEF